MAAAVLDRRGRVRLSGESGQVGAALPGQDERPGPGPGPLDTIAEVGAESRVAGASTELGDSHVAAVSGKWYIRAAADQRTFDQALPLVFAALNRHLGTRFT
ncbi:hypothetical protein AB0M50_55135 [Nonomuraea fuscirosea]|uniref:hypothetical protein n=1 Tax=Nonomuraea fuscirosea TaxID=1291556 RepID=UPI003423B804